MLPANTLQKLFIQYKTSIQGLNTTEANNRLQQYGFNLLQAKKRKSLLLLLLEEFKDLMVIILIVGATLALIAGENADATIIFFIVILNALIGFLQKFKAEKAIEALRKLIAPKAKIIRDNKQHEIEAKNVVPGDILILSEGDSITADAILFETNELEIQESTLTGESVPVSKLIYDLPETKGTPSQEENKVFMGTIITHGSGKAIVVGTGMNTEMGKIAKLTTETKKDLSPLEKELLRIGIFVGKIALTISGILLLTGIFIQGKNFIDTLLFATSVAVAAVPEGLPATVTIALAIGVQKLAKKNAIIKQLSSVETLGSTTIICSDKTGTLTKNEMTVKEIYFDQFSASIQGIGYDPKGVFEIEKNNEHYLTLEAQTNNHEELKKNKTAFYQSLEMLMFTAALCNNAGLVQDEGKQWKIVGDPTEGSLLTLVEKAGFKIEMIKKDMEKVYEVPFDSIRKRMSVIYRNLKDGKYYAFTKGAVDGIVQNCNEIILNGRSMKIDRLSREKFLLCNENMAKKALRVLGFAYREIAAEEIEQYKKSRDRIFTAENTEKNLIFIGIAGMIDPPRPEVKSAVEIAHQAGIRTYIITGDHGLTAKAIAHQLGIITDKRNHLVISGEEVNYLSDEKLKDYFQNKELDLIFARVSPEHKLRIVTLLKELDEIVAVTGDGVNDAPALKKADIGIAMGITGTDVSKEAANMILADDSYSTIVTAIKEGRTIYNNLKKFVFYVFSCNIAELLTIFIAIMVGIPAPLTAILILCIDLGTDVLPAVALGIDPAEPKIMQQKPRNPKEKIMSRKFIERYLYLGIIMGIIVISVYIWTLYRYGWNWGETLDKENMAYLKGSTTAFASLVLIQMVNAFNARSEQYSLFKIGIFSNFYLIGAICVSLIVSFLFIEVPFIQQYIHTTSLNINDWTIIIATSILVFIIEEIRKFFQRIHETRKNT